MKTYIFTFRNVRNEIVAIRAYRDWCEYTARLQAEADCWSLNAFRVSRAIGYQRCMIFG